MAAYAHVGTDEELWVAVVDVAVEAELVIAGGVDEVVVNGVIDEVVLEAVGVVDEVVVEVDVVDVVLVTVCVVYWKVNVPLTLFESTTVMMYVPITHDGAPPTDAEWEKVPESFTGTMTKSSVVEEP